MAVRFGYHCEECEEAVWPATTQAELRWLMSRNHVAREVSGHTSGGLDTWIMEGLEFLEHHSGHDIALVRRP